MSKFNYHVTVDQEPANPRKMNSNLCHMTLSHKRYDIGDPDQQFNTLDFCGWSEVQEWLKNEKNAFVIVKVSATDHSSFHIYSGEPKDIWDSGSIGFAWMTRKELIENFGGDDQKAIDEAIKAINDEINEYDRYLSGTFYLALIYNEGWEIVDSCGDFDSREEAEEWAKETIKELDEN